MPRDQFYQLIPELAIVPDYAGGHDRVLFGYACGLDAVFIGHQPSPVVEQPVGGMRRLGKDVEAVAHPQI